MFNKYLSNHIGRAGEYRVASELLLRDKNPAIRAVDNGVDIVLENGKTIQIKTVLGFKVKKWNVTLSSARYRKGKTINGNKRLLADFLIVWIVSKNNFYIIPSFEIGEVSSLGFFESGDKWTKYLNRWDLII